MWHTQPVDSGLDRPRVASPSRRGSAGRVHRLVMRMDDSFGREVWLEPLMAAFTHLHELAVGLDARLKILASSAATPIASRTRDRIAVEDVPRPAPRACESIAQICK